MEKRLHFPAFVPHSTIILVGFRNLVILYGGVCLVRYSNRWVLGLAGNDVRPIDAKCARANYSFLGDRQVFVLELFLTLKKAGLIGFLRFL